MTRRQPDWTYSSRRLAAEVHLSPRRPRARPRRPTRRQKLQRKLAQRPRKAWTGSRACSGRRYRRGTWGPRCGASLLRGVPPCSVLVGPPCVCIKSKEWVSSITAGAEIACFEFISCSPTWVPLFFQRQFASLFFFTFKVGVVPSPRTSQCCRLRLAVMAKVQPPPLTALADAPLRPLGGGKGDTVPAKELWKCSPSVVLVLRRPGCSAYLCCYAKHAVHDPGVTLFLIPTEVVRCLSAQYCAERRRRKSMRLSRSWMLSKSRSTAWFMRISKRRSRPSTQLTGASCDVLLRIVLCSAALQTAFFTPHLPCMTAT